MSPSSQWMHDEPERAAMSMLSDLLGIPHFTTSSGSTVRGDFLVAVARALGATDQDFLRAPSDARRGKKKNKDEVLALAWELARREPMPEALFVDGETVTNEHLEGIIEGIIAHGLGPASEQHQPRVGFHDLDDERRRRVALQAVRDGQNGFRNAVLEAYDNQCAVTSTDLPAALQAAHIAPYRGTRSHEISNALSLRADVHALFDRHMLAIDETNLRVLLSPAARATSYAELEGVQITVPRRRADRPDRDALERHRRDARL